MRIKAIQCGFSLSDAGLSKQGKPQNPNDPVVASLNELMKFKGMVTEKQIIEAFGMEYLEPEERDI